MIYRAILLISLLIGSIIGLRLRQDDAEAGIELLIPYYAYILMYVFLAAIFIAFLKASRKLVRPFFYSLALLIFVPFVFSGVESLSQYIDREKADKQEYLDYLGKLENYNLKIEEYPDSSLLFVERGTLKRSQGQWHESIFDCKIALSIEESIPALYELGYCYHHLGYLSKAKSAYEQILILDSTDNYAQKQLNFITSKISVSSD